MTNQIRDGVSRGSALVLSVALAIILMVGCEKSDSATPQASGSSGGGSAANAAPTTQATPREFEVALKPDIPEGYKDRVGKFEKPLRQDIKTLKLARNDDGTFNISFPAEAKVPAIEKIDVRACMPRVPKLAEGNAELEKIALIQRELNRNQTRYPLEGFGSAWIANNCLKKGLWEIGLDKKDEQGNWVTTYHGWFEFPRDQYERLFEDVNARPHDDAVVAYDDYPELNGLSVPLDTLRSVKKETPIAKVETNLDKAVETLPEQARKVKLIIQPQAKTYGEWVAADKQPVTVGKFSEPGYYNNADPVKFDIAWLAKPQSAVMREVTSKSAGDLAELEIKYANGNRLIVGSSELGKLPARSEPPKTEKDVLKVTFGISTPEIYQDAPDRAKEFASPANNYLLLLDAAGKHIDNHKSGIDRVFAWRDASSNLHLYLVGYERIMFVGHLTMPLPADQHASAAGTDVELANR